MAENMSNYDTSYDPSDESEDETSDTAIKEWCYSENDFESNA